MSHAFGQVLFKEGLILHFEYNGTSDCCIPNLYQTREELQANWRNHSWKEKCTCGNDEEVLIADCYGNGSWYEGGRACRHCLRITLDPVPLVMYPEDPEATIITYHDGLPDWWWSPPFTLEEKKK